MSNKYNVFYFVKEITRQFPTLDAILVYKLQMISCFLMLAWNPSSQQWLCTKGETLQARKFEKFCWLMSKIVQNILTIFSLWKREGHSQGQVPSEIEESPKSRISDPKHSKQTVAEKLFALLISWWTLGSMMTAVLTPYMSCHRNRNIKKIVHKHYLGIFKQLLRIASILMIVWRCCCAQNIKCFFSWLYYYMKS